MCIVMRLFWMQRNGSGYNSIQVELRHVLELDIPVQMIERVSKIKRVDQRLIIYGGSDVNGNAFSDLNYLEYGKYKHSYQLV